MSAKPGWRTLIVMTIAFGILLAAASSAGISRVDASDEPNWKIFIAKARGQLHPIQYWITGGEVVDMVPSVETSSFTITIGSTANGRLTIELSRELIDSRAGEDGTSGADKEFVVFADEVPVDVVETDATNTARTLAINFTEGTETIEIVASLAGMYVPPPKEWIAQITGRFLYSDPPARLLC
ncbi:MAG: hypothetical protein ACREAW_00065 [Nitrososphaera sp.]